MSNTETKLIPFDYKTWIDGLPDNYEVVTSAGHKVKIHSLSEMNGLYGGYFSEQGFHPSVWFENGSSPTAPTLMFRVPDVKSVNKRWRAEYGQSYFCVYYGHDRFECIETQCNTDDDRWQGGDYFETYLIAKYNRAKRKMEIAVKDWLRDNEVKMRLLNLIEVLHYPPSANFQTGRLIQEMKKHFGPKLNIIFHPDIYCNADIPADLKLEEWV